MPTLGRLLHARQDADTYRAGSRRGALPQHMESGARRVPPTLTVQNDMIWTVLNLIGILPVSTQNGGYFAHSDPIWSRSATCSRA